MNARVPISVCFDVSGSLMVEHDCHEFHAQPKYREHVVSFIVAVCTAAARLHTVPAKLP